MELKTNSQCQLILEGEAPVSGLEVIVYGENYHIVHRDDTADYWFFDMPEDGLYQYFVLNVDDNDNILEHIQDNVILPEAEIFSICKLRKCLLQKEKSYLSSFLHECSTGAHCSKNTEDETVRNFLLSSVFVLEHLICSGETTEALRILKNINSSCGLCDSKTVSVNCGCNGKDI